MFNAFDMLFLPGALLAGFIGYYVGVFIVLYLILIITVIFLLVKSLFGMDKIKAYGVLFFSTIVLSIASVAFFGVFSSRFFQNALIKRLNHILGAVCAVIITFMICRTMVLPLSLYLSESTHTAIANSFTVTSVVPLIQNILPGVQDALWQSSNNFITSVNPKPPEEEPAPDKDKKKRKKKKTAPPQKQPQPSPDTYFGTN